MCKKMILGEGGWKDKQMETKNLFAKIKSTNKKIFLVSFHEEVFLLVQKIRHPAWFNI